MSDSAGTRIAMGLGIIALVLVLGFVLERVSGGDVEPDLGGTGGDAPSDLQFCVAWQQLASVTEGERGAAAEDSADPTSAREALERARQLGVPEAMTDDARAGYAAALDEVQGRLEPSFVPTAYPANDAEDEAFGTYLSNNCPS